MKGWRDLKVKGGFPEAGTKERGDVGGRQRMEESDIGSSGFTGEGLCVRMDGLRQVLGHQALVKQSEDCGLFSGERDCGVTSTQWLGKDDEGKAREATLSCDTRPAAW